VIKSPVGNLQHTLVDVSQYTGQFLPGFDILEQKQMSNGNFSFNLFDSIDHVALAVDIGDTNDVIKWYNVCFGFHRLIINT